MSHKRLVFAFALLFLTPAVAAHADEARWLRRAVIAPDGTRIAFEYHGDIYVVSAEGGEARAVTSHVGREVSPVWSPDGATIVFASDRQGNFDLFAVPSVGGPETRLTFHSADDFPTAFSPDGSEVYFVSSRQDAPAALIGTTFLPELYAVPAQGGRPRQVLTTAALGARPSPDGKLLAYEDLKGYESPWRKHHTSSVARDVWTVDLGSGKHTRVTDFKGEDRDPSWLPDGGLAFLTERWGSFNVARRAPDGTVTQLTTHTTHPVRFLTAAKDGTLCYVFEGRVHLLAPTEGATPRAIRVDVRGGARENDAHVEAFTDGATEMAVAPSETELAFVVRGEVFVTSVEHGTTRRVTDTPTQERSVTWAPDGKSLYYAGERDGSWNIYRSVLAREGEERFFDATTLREEVVLATADETFQPLVSPDGKSLAFVRNRDEIAVLDLAGKAVRTVVPARNEYSYSDGDMSFAWSPDSAWLAFVYLPHKRWIEDVGAAEVATGRIVNLSQSGYSQGNPHWAPDGSAVAYFTDRYGRRNHGSWGGDADLEFVYLTRAAHDRARLSPEQFELLVAKEGKDKDGGKEKDEGAKEKEDGAQESPPEPVVIEEAQLDRRQKRITPWSTQLGDFVISKKAESVLYLARVGSQWTVQVARPRKGETSRLLELGEGGDAQLELSKDGSKLFVRTGSGGLMVADVPDLDGKDAPGDAHAEPIPFRAEMRVDGAAERAYIYEHAVRQVAEKFYREDLHGVDWKGLSAYYATYLGEITDNANFAELLSELLGELNASHTGARYRPERDESGDRTASLGLLFDTAYDGEGLRVAEVLTGGPADKAASRIAPGVIVTHLDGVALGVANPWPRLDRREGRPLLVSLRDPQGATWDERIRPVNDRETGDLLYRRWVRRCREIVHARSGGRIGYVQVRGMDDGSFREVFDDALGRESDCEALVVDTRWNGGGWLHDDLVKFLDGHVYGSFQPRGKEPGDIGTEPFQRWSRPVAVVQSESNYSDAHIFPYAFQQLGLGKLVGAPVAGTGTAVWWERQIDPTLVFGIPQVGIRTPAGEYLENLDLVPDELVLNTPEDVAAGFDRQLERAVDVLLEQLKTK